MNETLGEWGMSQPLPCLRRTEPSAALIPQPGQRTLAYVPAERSDIHKRIHEFNRLGSQAAHEESVESFAVEVVASR
jgi:hypothetical protein